MYTYKWNSPIQMCFSNHKISSIFCDKECNCWKATNLNEQSQKTSWKAKCKYKWNLKLYHWQILPDVVHVLCGHHCVNRTGLHILWYPIVYKFMFSCRHVLHIYTRRSKRMNLLSPREMKQTVDTYNKKRNFVL